jgi:hypothetical protein
MQIHELTKNSAEVPMLNEGLWQVAQAIFSSDPRFKGMDLRDRYRYMMTNQAVDQVANKAVSAWAGYVARRLGQDRNYLANPAIYKNDLRLFVNKNLMPAYQTIDQMTNKGQLYQVIDQIVANRADQQGNPAPQNQAGLFNQLVDLSAVSMVRDQAQRQQRGFGAAAGGAGGTQAGGGTGSAQFTPQAAQAFMQNFGMSPQQLQSFMGGMRQVAGTNVVKSTGNSAVDNLLRGFGFSIT